MKKLKDFTKSDQEQYNFNLETRQTVCNTAILESRCINKDERKFLNELEQKQDKIRLKYITKKEALGI